jgi:hypothetical protein
MQQYLLFFFRFCDLKSEINFFFGFCYLNCQLPMIKFEYNYRSSILRLEYKCVFLFINNIHINIL